MGAVASLLTISHIIIGLSKNWDVHTEKQSGTDRKINDPTIQSCHEI